MKRAIIISAIIASLSPANGQMFAQLFGGEAWTPAQLSPVAWWTFESAPGGVVSDVIASKAMTLTGSPTISAGLRGNAITTEAGKYGSFTAFSTTNIFSISLWAKTSKPTANMVLMGSSASTVVFINKTDATTIYFRTVGATFPPFSIPSFGTAWRMVSVTCDGTVTRFYIDGVESASGPNVVTSPNLGAFNQIGRFAGGVSIPWAGQIDEMTVYDYTLSRAQITQLYNYR